MTSIATAAPVSWWGFEQEGDKIAYDQAANLNDTIEGNFKQCVGVKGKALKLDGYTTCIVRDAAKAPTLKDNFTVDAWLAFGAYPWNWCPVVTQADGQKAGYSLSAGPRGQIRLQVVANGKTSEAVSDDWAIGLFEWVHVAGVCENGKLRVIVNGRSSKPVNLDGKPQWAGKMPLRIGMNYEETKPSNIHREHGTVPTYFSLDGIIDEVRIFDRALSDAELSKSAETVSKAGKPDLQKRVLPAGPKKIGRFGAFYTQLKYYDEWDDLWPVGPDTDIVVGFDNSEVRVVFWRGSRYSPAWVTPEGQWMADQSVEAWDHDKTGAQGCYEHMQDRLCRYSHVRIIESTPARVVVHWRYAPVSAHNHLWQVNPKTGRGCWVDEYYTIYPDQTGVRKVMWKTGTLGYPRQFQESLPFTGPGQMIGDIVHEQFATVGNLAGETKEMSYTKGTPVKNPPTPSDLIFQQYNFKSSYKPFIVHEQGNKMRGVRDFKMRGAGMNTPGYCNHWPVGQARCDGRTVQAADRPTHFLGFPITTPKIHQANGRSWWNGLYGMAKLTIPELQELAKSYNNAPVMTIEGDGMTGGSFDLGERAYVLTRTNKNAPLNCQLAASADSPIRNIALVIKNWGDQNATSLTVNGQKWNPGKTFRSGLVHRLDGTELTVWIKLHSTKPVDLEIR
ncbi:MAG: LamG domain-containing protein [Verrucomicrobiae bacterium]|nr:LamG domain-containing protein [Verrucomicrobiae bacterium]NNJ87750.1 LamG domain-containing protein [Akkermansiaceae bacterium]